MSEAVTDRLAALEGAEAALVLASGMAALSCTMLALLRPGDHLLASNLLRHSTKYFLENELPALGVSVTLVDGRNARAWRRGLSHTTRALFVENPALESATFVSAEPALSLSRELGLASVIDSTGASPILCQPIIEGADVVIHDASYLLDGSCSNGAGVVCGTDSIIEEVRNKMHGWGAIPDNCAITRLGMGLDTLEVRIRRQYENMLTVREWAMQQPAIGHVICPTRTVSTGDGAGSVSKALPVSGLTMILGTASANHTLNMVSNFSGASHLGELNARNAAHTTRIERRSTDGSEYHEVLITVGIEPTDWIIGKLQEALH